MVRILVGDMRWAGLLMRLCLALCLPVSSTWAQQVWKCEVAGKVVFSDKPCPQTGKPLAERNLQPNVVDAMKPEVVDAAMGRPPAASVPQAPAGNACPGDGELRGMETRGNSTTLGDAERQFLQDEMRRVRQCRSGQGRYREGDWDISREAQAAQTQLSDRVRDAARQRAEAMHSAADPEEGDRIARRRIAEERLARRQQRQWQNGQNPAASSPR
ncbi:hypothetical protein [Roseateles sp.]|uniref:hypothetical protein n=1 Tax=Roseateles sp. TaxID=1971397 RepID=UPI003266953F